VSHERLGKYSRHPLSVLIPAGLISSAVQFASPVVAKRHPAARFHANTKARAAVAPWHDPPAAPKQPQTYGASVYWVEDVVAEFLRTLA